MIGETLPGRQEKIVHVSPLYVSMAGKVTACSMFTVEAMLEAMAYCPQDDDLIIGTFPKCGTTWTQEIVRLIFGKGVPCKTLLERNEKSPFIDHTGFKGVTDMERPGAIKTHLAANLLNNLDKGKYIYVLRNPKDVVVSYFHHQRNAFRLYYQYTEGNFEDFFELFMNGPTEYDDYFDHLISWYPHTKKDNVLFVNYEELKDDTRGQILRIAKFIGDEWHDMLMEEGMLDKIVELSSFGSMKKTYQAMEIPVENLFQTDESRQAFVEENKDNITEDGNLQVRTFIRSGKVGGWKKYFTDEMDRRMNERIIERMMPVCPEIVQLWKDHGVMD